MQRQISSWVVYGVPLRRKDAEAMLVGYIDDPINADEHRHVPLGSGSARDGLGRAWGQSSGARGQDRSERGRQS